MLKTSVIALFCSDQSSINFVFLAVFVFLKNTFSKTLFLLQVFIHRRNLRNFIKERQDAGHVVVICGAENEDMYVAAQTKSLLIAPYWVPLEEKVIHYGVQALTPRKMRAILDIIVNQTSWYYSCYFNDPVPTKVFSLCSANTFPCFGVSQGEIAMANEFKAILKYGVNNPVIRQALLCHLMAGEDIQLTTNDLFCMVVAF